MGLQAGNEGSNYSVCAPSCLSNDGWEVAWSLMTEETCLLVSTDWHFLFLVLCASDTLTYGLEL